MPRRGATRNTGKTRALRKHDTLDDFFGASSSPPRAGKVRASGSRLDDDDDSQSSDAGAIHFEAAPTATDEDDPKSSPRHPSRKRRLRKRRADSDEENELRQSSEEETGVPVTWKSSGKAAGKRKAAAILDDEDEEEAQPRKRKLVKGQRPPTPEEEEDLLHEVDEERIIESRLRSRDKKSAFQKNLEKLKRKKRGQSLASSSSAEDDEIEDVPFADARPDKAQDGDSSQDGDDDAEEDTFIIEDDNAVAPELPPEFSMNTYQDLLHHFKIICQMFVHLAVHEQDERGATMADLSRNQYFAVPLQITRRKLVGMRDSLVTSSVWRTDYKKSLETYPDFEVHQLDFTVSGCDACHLGSRMSTRLGRLSGLPYDRDTFESFEERDSDDDSDEGDSENEGHDPCLKKEFNLGRFCAARTRVFHRFSHWEYALFGALAREVDELRTGASTRGFVRVAYARGVQPPDDLSDADGIMDWLDERGIINLEWQKIKEMMESARNLEMKAKKGEDDDD
ncbi:hypothetical protein DAEQUDRAFT_728731 [Daedalea quercina L-15889]|uniref:DUF4211 domain-containing protein n=1 Tax=Daedalea quercina L-15889 TaxID=1314783 RepID=A0A165P426_9APHY|nr:hypothetical protein DAEQUDRAFT_728731 [Daedalea quercina L-15889]